MQKELSMRQRRWLKLLKDYDMKVKYHLGRANVVADTLGRKSKGSVASLLTIERIMLRALEALQIEIVLPRDKNYMGAL